MRTLFTSFPSYGHLHPLLPLAHAVRERGHEVVVATAEAFRAVVERTGLPLAPAGLSEPAIVREASRRFPEAGAGERGLFMFAHVAAPPMLAGLERHVERWAPELIVHEEGEWAGPLAAALANVPSVAHGWGSPLWSEEELRRIDRAITPLWESHELTPGSPAALFDHLYLDPCPPPLQAPHAAAIRTRRQLRFEAFDGGEPLPSWFHRLGRRPAIYVTLGTVPAYNRAPELVATVITALGDEDVDVVVTVGPDNDPRAFDSRPANVRVERYLPQARILSACSLAITHGGAGSTLAALSYGLPVLLVPRGAPSQLRMAKSCVDAGVGRTLADEEISPDRIAADVRALLEDRSYRTNAARVRESVFSVPRATDVVAGLEDLVITVERKMAERRSVRASARP